MRRTAMSHPEFRDGSSFGGDKQTATDLLSRTRLAKSKGFDFGSADGAVGAPTQAG